MNTVNRRRQSPTWYLVLGTLWTVLAVGGWGTSGSAGVTAAFALLGVANLALGAHLLRRQRTEAGRGIDAR